MEQAGNFAFYSKGRLGKATKNEWAGLMTWTQMGFVCMAL